MQFSLYKMGILNEKRCKKVEQNVGQNVNVVLLHFHTKLQKVDFPKSG